MGGGTLADTYAKAKAMLLDAGYSLKSVLKELMDRVVARADPDEVVWVVPRLAEAEYRLSVSCSEALQLGFVIAVFRERRG